MLATIYVLANRQQVRFDREVALFSQLEQSAQKLRSVQNDLESWIFRAKSYEVSVCTLEDQLDIASTSTQEALLVTEQAITQKEELLQEQIKFLKLQNRLKNELALMSVQFEALNAKYAERSKEIALKLSVIPELESTLNATRISHNGLQQRLLNEKSEVIALRAELATRNQELKRVDFELSSRESSLQELKQSSVATTRLLNEETNKFKNIELLLAAYEKRFAEMTEQQQELNNSTDRELDSLRNSLLSVSSLRDRQANIIISRDSIIKQLSDALQNEQTSNGVLQDQLRNTNELLSMTNTSIQELTGRIKVLELDNAVLNEQISSLQRELDVAALTSNTAPGNDSNYE